VLPAAPAPDEPKPASAAARPNETAAPAAPSAGNRAVTGNGAATGNGLPRRVKRAPGEAKPADNGETFGLGPSWDAFQGSSAAGGDPD
jgi:hypothetical protein